MASSPFVIFTRHDTKTGKNYFCAKFQRPDGTMIKSVSLRTAKSRTAAARQAEKLLADGVVPNDANPDAMEFLRDFWRSDSDYVKSRALRGVTLSTEYIKISAYRLEKHLSPYLKGKTMTDLNTGFVEKVILSMSAKGATPRTINTCLQVLRVPYKYFCKTHGLVNQLAGVEPLIEKTTERGVLTGAEVGKIIRLDCDARAKAAVLLGALCGLRLGEVRGLQITDIDFDLKTIRVRNNFTLMEDGLHSPKWDSFREVSAPGPVIEALQLCIKSAPKPTAFAVWNRADPAHPIGRTTPPAMLRALFIKIGIDAAQTKARNLCFHGLRHTFVSLSRAGGVPDFLVMRMAGHKNAAMMEHYSHSEGIIDFKSAREALEKAVGQ